MASKISERKFIDMLCEVTGMNYCDKNCGCGENSELMFWPVSGTVPEWLPDWTNGTNYMEVYQWLQEAAPANADVLSAVQAAGLTLAD